MISPAPTFFHEKKPDTSAVYVCISKYAECLICLPWIRQIDPCAFPSYRSWPIMLLYKRIRWFCFKKKRIDLIATQTVAPSVE